jgi:nitrate reductase NapAB chaperone NapD
MADEDTLGRLEIVADEIAQVHDTGVQEHEGKDGRWIVSIETEDKAVTGTGFSKAAALSDLIKECRATGWAT